MAIRAGRSRARLALVAAVLWLAGFEVLPWIHVALHDDLAPHVHTADGTIFRVSFDEPTHRHADGTIHHAHGSGSGSPTHDHRTRAGGDLGHGDGALAHHGVAAIPAAPPLHHPLPVDRRPSFEATNESETLLSSAVPIASARGPPLVSCSASVLT